MKKLFSAVLALTMVASTFVTTAFAAGTNFAIKANKASYDEGATVTVTVTITGETFNGFATTLSYDPEIFTWDKGGKAGSSTLSGSAVFGNNAELGEAYATYGVASNEETEVEVEDEETGDTEIKPATWTYYYRFKVNSNVKAGDYAFTLTEKGAGNMNSEDGALTVSFGEPITVHVNGTKADEVKPSVDAAADEVRYAASTIPGKKTAGFATTVTPANGGAFKKLTANIGNGSVNKDFVIYEGVSIEASTVFGLNITQVPVDVTITVNSVVAE